MESLRDFLLLFRLSGIARVCSRLRFPRRAVQKFVGIGRMTSKSRYSEELFTILQETKNIVAKKTACLAGHHAAWGEDTAVAGIHTRGLDSLMKALPLLAAQHHVLARVPNNLARLIVHCSGARARSQGGRCLHCAISHHRAWAPQFNPKSGAQKIPW